MPIQMKSLKSHRYGTRMLTAGEEFEVRGESEARLMHALKRGERVKVEAPAPAPAPELPKWRRAAPATPVTEGEEARPKRSYVRRNLTSTED